MDWALAALTAARRRAYMSGSGAPIFAATVISRESLENIAERFLSCAPLRYMMFLYLLCPAIAVTLSHSDRSGEPQGRLVGVEQRLGLLAVVGFHLPQADDGAHRLGVGAPRPCLAIDVPDVVGDRLLLFLEPLDPLDQQPQLVGRDASFRQFKLPQDSVERQAVRTSASGLKRVRGAGVIAVTAGLYSKSAEE